MSIERDIEELHKLHGLNPTEKLIVDVKGTPFIKAAGIVKIAHTKGIGSLALETQHQDWAKNIFVVKATYTLKDGQVFEDFGSASPASCKLQTGGDVMIMVAATRAKVRAMRTAHGISLTAVEEMGFEQTEPRQQVATQPQASTAKEPQKRQAAPVRKPSNPTPSMASLPTEATAEWKAASSGFRGAIKGMNYDHIKGACKKFRGTDSSRELTAPQLNDLRDIFNASPSREDREFAGHWETQITSFGKTEDMTNTALDSARNEWQFVLACKLFAV